MKSAVSAPSQCQPGSTYELRGANADTNWSTACKPRAGTRSTRAVTNARRSAHTDDRRVRCWRACRCRSIAGGVLAKPYRSSGLPSKRSSIVHAVPMTAPISMRAAFVTADRRLDFTPNPALLAVRLRTNRHSAMGLFAEVLPHLLPRRGETIAQATEIVATFQVF
jgi:hypothetical protein